MKSFEQKLLGRLYCFCGGGDSTDDDPDTGDFGVDTGSGGDDSDGVEAAQWQSMFVVVASCVYL